MPVTNITVRFSRKVQVRQFEPMEAEITAVFVVDEGEEIPSAASFLIETKDAVMQGLRHKAREAIEAADGEAEMTEDPAPLHECSTNQAVPAREPGKPSPGKKRRTAAEVAEDAKALADMMDGGEVAQPTPAATEEIGPAGDDPAPLHDPDTFSEEDPNPGCDDFPTGRTEVAGVNELGPVDPAPVTGVDLSDFDAPAETIAVINNDELLKIASAGATTLDAEAIRTMVKGFGVKQLVQLTADQRATFQTQVTDAIAAAKS